ncbi:NAD(+) synthase [Dysgonomonas sp. 25]|uniref:NAD(+) synthase n=1 Tax=Dysgonomonas sp. 25 TaxID=2302933 RepID=UPI001625CB8A
MNYGFVRVAAATPSVKVADCDYNARQIIDMATRADKQGVSAAVFPEMGITSYTANDLFNQRPLIDGALAALKQICEETKNLNIIIVAGSPIEIANRLYNTGVVIYRGEIRGIVPKTFLPNYNEFYDKRWFASSAELSRKSVEIFGKEIPVGIDLIFETPEFNFALDICEDLWTPIPPSSYASLFGADIIFNLSASNETAGKHLYRKSLVSQQSARCIAGYVYAAAGNGESTTDVVFGGSSLIAENGAILSEGERFSFENRMITADIDVDRLRNDRLKNKSFSLSEYHLQEKNSYRYIRIEQPEKKIELNRYINPTPFVPTEDALLNERCEEIFAIQIGGLAKRLLHTSIQKAVVGVSGGLDSTLALLVMVKAYDKLGISRENIIGITMPGFGTTDRTYGNAIQLMKSLGITSVEISIVDAVNQHFKDIDQDANRHDITYENSQARERTQILMDYANKVNGLVIGTGDLSELALGWCTYNGDHMSMYAVNTGIPKTLVRTLVKWVADTQMDEQSKTILHDVVDTPVSPELLPADENGEIAQKTEDVVGPYVLHDFFLYNVLRCGFSPAKIFFLAQHAFGNEYDKETILKWLKAFFRRFFSQQFKRSCLPDGPKVGSVNLSPRGDWRMVSDASAALWMKELDNIRI